MGVAPLMRPCLARLVRLVSAVQRFARYGIGRGPGTGATAQIADAHGGRGGVGKRTTLPWVAAEPPVIHLPVKVSLLG
jgi:hypothetical protein